MSSRVAESGEETRRKLARNCASRTRRGDILELWYNPDLKAQSELIEYPELLKILSEIEAKAEYTVNRIDATKSSAEQRKNFYDSMILRWHDENHKPGYYFAYPLRTPPGTRKDYEFGVKRPVLVVYRGLKSHDCIVDVYPHQEKALVPDPELSLIADPHPKLTISVTDFLNALNGT